MATIYRSTDTGAPTLTNAAGSLIGVLDAVLVNGYGSKAAAGWTKAFSGTNKAAYRNGASAQARSYLRVDNSVSASTMPVRGFHDMTDVDIGTGPFPTSADAPTCIWRVPDVSTARPWICVADARTLLYMVQATSSEWFVGYFGDGESVYTGDANFAVMGGLQTTNSYPVSSIAGGLELSTTPTWNEQNTFTVKAPLSGGNPVLAKSALPTFADFFNTNRGGYLASPSEGRYYMATVLVNTWVGSGNLYIHRGRLRFLYRPMHTYAALSHGASFVGAGELAGKTFEIVKPVVYVGGPGYTVLAFTGDE